LLFYIPWTQLDLQNIKNSFRKVCLCCLSVSRSLHCSKYLYIICIPSSDLTCFLFVGHFVFILCFISGNAAFIAVMAAADGIGGDDYKKWAMTQINYLLGDNNRHMSYEIGFGNNFPHQPHHRGAYVSTI